jgi:hypothetical protein
VNAAREARAALPVNSFWLWGTGAAPAAAPPAADPPVVDDRLRVPWRAEDWAGWTEAWQALDADVIAGLARRAAAGEAVSLTLAGERRACRFDSHPRPGWRRWLAGLRRASAPDWLAAL